MPGTVHLPYRYYVYVFNHFYWNLLCPPPPVCTVPLALFSSPWTFLISFSSAIREQSWKFLSDRCVIVTPFWFLADIFLVFVTSRAFDRSCLNYYSRFSYILIRYTFYLNLYRFLRRFFSIPNNRRNSLRQLTVSCIWTLSILAYYLNVIIWYLYIRIAYRDGY